MIKSRLRIISLLVIICANQRMFAQTNTDLIKQSKSVIQTIDSLFSNYARRNHFPGFVYGLIVDGKLIYTGNTGYINLAEKIPAKNISEFRIASMTKSFTALAILRLRDEGKLKLDDSASMYIPELATQKYLSSDAPPITIRHLLTHMAGFPEDNPWGDRQLDVSEADLMKMIRNGIAFSNIPGVKFEYSNLGFTLLGVIIHKITGQTYESYITENILLPLGMTHTFFEYSQISADYLAHGYRWVGKQWDEEPLLHDGAFGAMGGMITSAEDFSKYLIFHLSAWPSRNNAETGPVRRSSVREMQLPCTGIVLNKKYKFPGGRECPVVTAYAYGLRWIRDCEGRTMTGHSGGLPGFGSNWLILADYNIGVFSFSNLTYAPTQPINHLVLDTLITLANLHPIHLNVSDILNQRKNELIRILPDWKNVDINPIFADNFFKDYSIDALKNESIKIFGKAGKIMNIHEFIPENNLRGSFMLEGENSDIEISFTLTPENPPLIQEYHIREMRKNN
jgi:CubicO group peptidase (beta-lactamase class C family)